MLFRSRAFTKSTGSRNFFPPRFREVRAKGRPIGQPRTAPYIEAMDSTRPKLVIRNSETRDAAGIARPSAKVYGRAEGSSAAQSRGQIHNFPAGACPPEYEGPLVGFCAPQIVPAPSALPDHRRTATHAARLGPPP